MVYIKLFVPFIFYTLTKSWSRHQFEGRNIPNRCCLLVQISDNLKEEIYQIYYVVYLFRSWTSQSLDWNMRKFESTSSGSPSIIVLSSFLCYLLVVVVNNACYPCLPAHCCDVFNIALTLKYYTCIYVLSCIWPNMLHIYEQISESSLINAMNVLIFVNSTLFYVYYIEQDLHWIEHQ